MLLIQVARLVVVHIIIASVKPPVASLKGTYMLLRETTIRAAQANFHQTPNFPSTDEILKQHMIASDAKFQLLANQMTNIEKALNERPQVPSPTPLSSSKEVERDPETTMDQVHISSLESTARVPSLVNQPAPASKSNEILERNPHQPLIPYPSRLNNDKLQDKSDIQIHKFLQMFKKLHFNISFAKALAQMPKYANMLKDLLSNKDKLLELANTLLNENCSAVLLKKLPEKLRDPRRFLIPCDFSELKECMSLADLGANINLMPLSVWKKLMLPELIPTLGKFMFLADFIVVDYDIDPRVPLILGRPFLRTARALVDVHGEELIVRTDAFLALDLIPPGIDNEIFDAKRDILLLENLLNIDSTKDLPPQELNNDSEGDIFFLDNLLEAEPS
ncbi:reverse transcriptase domain-containing protein [Tanacetum coccineum]